MIWNVPLPEAVHLWCGLAFCLLRCESRRDVSCWPEGEVLTCVRNVCSLGNCGRDVLALSLTGFDP
jgi:hypothetical protein